MKKNLDQQQKIFYTRDLEMSNAVVNLIEFPYEVSDGWQKNMKCPCQPGKIIIKTEIISTLRYLELKKIKKLIGLNAEELGKTTSAERQMLLIQTHSSFENNGNANYKRNRNGAL